MESVRRTLEEQLSANGWDSLNRRMYGFFNKTFYADRIRSHLGETFFYEDNFGADIVGKFMDMLDDFVGMKYEDFADLMSSNEVMLFAFSLYNSYNWYEDYFFLESLDGTGHKIDKKAAITESEVFEDMFKQTDDECETPIDWRKIDKMLMAAATSELEVSKDRHTHRFGGYGSIRHGIPLSVSGDTLPKVIDFMEKTFDFRKHLDRYKDWVTDFLKANWNILPDLYQAADYLKIGSILNLTSLVGCHIRSKADTLWESKNDFSKLFKSFQTGYKGCVKGFVNARNAVISDLHRAANLAEIQSPLESSSHSMESMMGRTLSDILDSYAKLTFP